jgi:hypothetical protein
MPRICWSWPAKGRPKKRKLLKVLYRMEIFRMRVLSNNSKMVAVAVAATEQMEHRKKIASLCASCKRTAVKRVSSKTFITQIMSDLPRLCLCDVNAVILAVMLHQLCSYTMQWLTQLSANRHRVDSLKMSVARSMRLLHTKLRVKVLEIIFFRCKMEETISKKTHKKSFRSKLTFSSNA